MLFIVKNFSFYLPEFNFPPISRFKLSRVVVTIQFCRNINITKFFDSRKFLMNYLYTFRIKKKNLFLKIDFICFIFRFVLFKTYFKVFEIETHQKQCFNRPKMGGEFLDFTFYFILNNSKFVDFMYIIENNI